MKTKKQSTFNSLRRKIDSKAATVAVIGQGYVGFPLACAFAGEGFETIGVDTDARKVRLINRGRSPILDISHDDISHLVLHAKLLRATTDYDALTKVDIIVICVPTPLNKAKDPDISFIVSAAKQVAKRLRKGQLVILESTTYPGTTEELILPALSRIDLKVGKDFFLCFSPERIDPGNKKYRVANIPKIVGGITANCTKLGSELYGVIADQVVPVSSSKTAEMAKLLENTFRIVNIGLINELAIVANRLNVDIWEAIRAAATKPFGYMPFYPGPGIGGHCIGVDPLYLSWKARLLGAEIRFIELANRMNVEMPNYVVKRATFALNTVSKSMRGARVIILGAAYKRDVDDTRESPAIEIIEGLTELGAKVSFYDPYVKVLNVEGRKLRSVSLNAQLLKKSDLVVVVTGHSRIDYQTVAKHSPLILDTRNALGMIKGYKKKIIKL